MAPCIGFQKQFPSARPQGVIDGERTARGGPWRCWNRQGAQPVDLLSRHSSWQPQSTVQRPFGPTTLIWSTDHAIRARALRRIEVPSPWTVA